MTRGLIARLKDKPTDEGRWAEWHKSVYPKIYFAAYRWTGGNPDDARDLTQETLARFLRYRGLEKVADDGSAVAFLLKTCRNAFLDWVSEERRLAGDPAVKLEDISVDETAIDDVLDINRLAQQLDTDDQRLLKMARAGLTLTEIAAETGLTYTAAGVRLHRLKKRLRALAG